MGKFRQGLFLCQKSSQPVFDGNGQRYFPDLDIADQAEYGIP